ncbi:(2Fe-2S)-binding protein [Pseudomonas sp. KU26590]
MNSCCQWDRLQPGRGQCEASLLQCDARRLPG